MLYYDISNKSTWSLKYFLWYKNISRPASLSTSTTEPLKKREIHKNSLKYFPLILSYGVIFQEMITLPSASEKLNIRYHEIGFLNGCVGVTFKAVGGEEVQKILFEATG